MSEVSIPFALDPHGTEVPIEEAIRFKTDYYVCPECGEFVDPRKGEQRKYFAHKKGVLEDTECELSSQADIDEIVDKLRTSDVEQEESERLIRTYIGEEPGGRHQMFGVMPSIEWEQLPPGVNVDSVIEDCSLESEGLIHAPTPRSFHPSEPEVIFELDPTESNYRISFEGPSYVDNLAGDWTTDPLQDGDLFAGDQTRARRFQANRQVQTGEWIYIVTDDPPSDAREGIDVHSIGNWALLAFPARSDTADLLDEYGTGLRTDDYGFDADIILPADAHPTADKPIVSEPGTTVLIGVTPAEELDPVFEIVSIPKQKGDLVELEQTGPGNTRFHKAKIPQQGSKRVSVHQRNSSRHRLVHLHARDSATRTGADHSADGEIGIRFTQNSHTETLSPTGNTQTLTVDESVSPMTLPTAIEYVGPTGLDIEVMAHFPSEHPESPFIRRTTDEVENILPNLGHWVTQGCTAVDFTFEGIGTVSLSFAQNVSPQSMGSENV